MKTDMNMKKRDVEIRNAWENAEPMALESIPSAAVVFEKAKNRERIRNRRIATMSSVAAVMLVAAGTTIFLNREPLTVYTAENEKVDVELPDGTRVCLNRNSELSFAGEYARRVNLAGEAYFDVAKDDNNTFEVKTEKMNITVHGTKFTVSAYKHKTPAAWLEEGSVSVTGKGLEETLLKPDQAISFDGRQWQKTYEKAERHTLWAHDRLVMENMSLTDIVSLLEHWYGVLLTVSDPGAADNTFLSLTVRNESVDTILESINLISETKVSK